jgi:type IV secretory pathway VirB10-like protein
MPRCLFGFMGPLHLRLALLAALAVFLTACERRSPEQPSTPATSAPASPEAPAPLPTVPGPPRQEAPQVSARDEREDPDRVLRRYAAALLARDWTAAAKAWGRGSGVTAATLQSAYDRAETPVLTVGEGRVEGAAGTLYYEAPVTLRFGDSALERGTLALRRANDVPGASAEQLRWRIVRSSIGQGQ